MNQSQFKLDDAVALLKRTPAALDALLRGLPDVWTRRNEGGESWTAYDIVGHLAHGERTDWVARAKRILEHGESVPFDKFDRTAMLRESEGKTLEQLLDEFSELRRKNLEEIGRLRISDADLTRRGSHPALGKVTLENLLATWAAHDLTHLHQLSRVMAYQYREAVGPWTKFLGVLKCGGHSE